MRLIEKLIAKRDAAHAEYVKWAGMVEVLQSDPDFISVAHFGATKVMQAAREMANGNGHSNGDDEAVKKSAAARKGWTPARRKLYSERLKAYNPMHDKPKGSTQSTPEYRAKQSARMKKLWKDKREVMLAGVRKNGKLGRKARRAKLDAAQA